jgi:hypothetical protein
MRILIRTSQASVGGWVTLARGVLGQGRAGAGHGARQGTGLAAQQIGSCGCSVGRLETGGLGPQKTVTDRNVQRWEVSKTRTGRG